MTNYSRGAAFEHSVMDALKRKGYYVIRSAGSHGEVDLAAFRADTSPWFIQCKLDGYLSPAERRELWDTCRRNDAVPIKAMRNKGIRFYRMISDKEWEEVKP